MIVIDAKQGWVEVEDEGGRQRHSLSSPEAFRAISEIWLRCGFDNKYVYSFTWMGRPVIQLPEDLLRVQEVIFQTQPDVIIETGVAHGGGVCFYSSLCKMMGKGRVIGVDIEIRPHNRQALEAHPLREYFTLVEGDSVAAATLRQVEKHVGSGEKVMVVLDSKHSREHVLAEMEAYSKYVSPRSYLVVADGIMKRLGDSPLGAADWPRNNPLAAIEIFLSKHSEFCQVEPKFLFNEGGINDRVTYWPGGYLLRTA